MRFIWGMQAWHPNSTDNPALLFILFLNWEWFRSPSTGEWIKTSWHMQTVDYYSGMKMNNLLEYAVMRILSQTSCREKAASHTSMSCRILGIEDPKSSIVTEVRSVAALCRRGDAYTQAQGTFLGGWGGIILYHNLGLGCVRWIHLSKLIKLCT